MANEQLRLIDDMQHWTRVIGQAQQMLMEFALSDVPRLIEEGTHMAVWQKQWEAWINPESWQRWMQNPAAIGAFMPSASAPASASASGPSPTGPAAAEPAAVVQQWMQIGFGMWQNFAASLPQLHAQAQAQMKAAMGEAEGASPPPQQPERDRRFAAPEWQQSPLFAFIRHSYGLIAEQMQAQMDGVDGLDPRAKAAMRYAMQGLIDAAAPSNFALTNPQVMARTLETRGDNLLKGLAHMLADLKRGQLTHTDPDAFEVGRNIAITPGKVVHETPLYQLIHYAPVTDDVLAVPLVIFPPWINRFYILDLNPAKSFVKWATEQGLSVFMVSWKSADASMADVVWDDYIAAQIDAINVIRALLDVPHVHSIGYCVAGTTLAATLAILHARGGGDIVRSATFFTAQVDFELAGDLKLFVDDAQLALLDQLSAPGYLDGRYMAATFNALRGRDLIWSYVVNNYLLGEDYPPFDLLHWNGDTTNLPAKWHRQYLADLYRDNLLIEPGRLSALGTPIDLTRITTPAFIQAGREDHIAPAESVWRIMDHLRGPKRFLLAGSGHIAGVVNPPSAAKYQYWINEDEGVATLADYIAGAREVPGSWWPSWLAWLKDQDEAMVPATGPRIPGKGGSRAIEDAPGRYVRTR